MKKIVLLSLLLIFPAQSQLKWELMSPTPTFSDIYDVWTFNDSTVLIAGKSGLCMKTSDGGTTWTNCSVNTTSNLKGVHFLNDNDGWMFDASSKLYKSTNGGESWTLRYTLQDRLITSIFFKDANNGYMGSDYRLYVTTDGGVSWTPKHFNNYIYGFKVFGNTLFCATSATGYVGKLYRSTNNGATWDTIYSMQGYPVLDFDLNSQGVLICVGKGFAARSTDMGASWVFLAFNYRDFFNVEFLDDSRVFVAGELNLMSWNSGADWTELTNLAYLYGVSCSQNTIVAAGYEGKIFRSTDGGLSWIKMFQKKDYILRAAFFTSRDTGFLAGDVGTTQLFRKTTDGARTWREIPWHPTYYTIGDITFIEGGAKGFLHARNKIMSSTDYGETWFDIAAPLNSNDRLLKFFFVDDQYGYALGSNKFILKTTDGGTTWTRNTITASSNLEGIYFVNRDVGFIYGESGVSIYKTSDGGLTWALKYYEYSGFPHDIHFYSANEGFFYTSSFDLYTTNQGETWTYYASYLPRILAMDHIDNLNGFASMMHGQSSPHPLMIGVTRNGKDWTTEYLPLPLTSGIMRMGDGGTAYLFSSNDILIKITDPAFTSIEEDEKPLPGGFTLAQNYPNPFNPETVIRFELPTAGFAKGVVYDILGKEVATLVDGEIPAGEHRLSFNGANLPSGVYIFRLVSGKNSSSIKMLLTK